MSSASISRGFKKLKWTLLFLAAPLGHAGENGPWNLLIEPNFLKYEIARRIPGSDRTLIVPARFQNGEPVPFTREQKKHLPISFDQIEISARKNASEILSGLKPEFTRDENGVIAFATLESKSPLTATSVLAPDFAKKFANTLGPDLLLAIPTRYKVLVFSKYSDAYLRMALPVIAEYQGSPHPVSREVFELKKGRLRVIGVYQ